MLNGIKAKPFGWSPEATSLYAACVQRSSAWVGWGEETASSAEQINWTKKKVKRSPLTAPIGLHGVISIGPPRIIIGEPDDSKGAATMAEFVGLDGSKDTTAICVKDASGSVLAEMSVETCPQAIFEALRAHCDCPERIVLETGSQSGWLQRELVKRGLPVVLVDARQVHAVMKLQHNKTDANDAGFYRGVATKSVAAHEAHALLKARDLLVRQRRDIDNTIRGLLRSFGLRLPTRKGRLVLRIKALIADRPEFAQVVEPLLSGRAALIAALEQLDDRVEEKAKRSPTCASPSPSSVTSERLQQTGPGVRSTKAA